MVEHIAEILALPAAIGRHVLEDRLLAEIEADHRGHVGIDRLVVGDAGADRVRERDIAGAIGVEEAGRAEDRIRPEGQGIDEIVVDPAIDDIDALQALRSCACRRYCRRRRDRRPRPARRPSRRRGRSARNRRCCRSPGVSSTTTGSPVAIGAAPPIAASPAAPRDNARPARCGGARRGPGKSRIIASRFSSM